MQEKFNILVDYCRRKVRRPESGSGHKCKRRTDILTGLKETRYVIFNERIWLITCYSFELCEEAMFLISKEKRNFFNI